MSNLLDVAIEAHGGLKLWREVKEVELKLSLTGVLTLCRMLPARKVRKVNFNQLWYILSKTSYDD